MYKIATENGLIGHSLKTLQAQITLGLKKGYNGFLQEKKEVLNFLTDLYKTAGTNNKPYIPFVVGDVVITYAYPTDSGWHGEHEPALALISDKNPIYAASLSDDEWKSLVEEYASLLGEKFQQFRVYVTYAIVETKIFQKQ